ILGPQGKLSKRDGAKYGFPVFAMNWSDPKSGELTEGFKERGFLPEAFINLLAMIGWNDGTEKEMYSMEELIQSFSMDRVHKAGAKFDFEKARWYNQEWIKQSSNESLYQALKQYDPTLFAQETAEKVQTVIGLVKERCTLLADFHTQAGYFFTAPTVWDLEAVKPKWNDEKNNFFQELISRYQNITVWDHLTLEQELKSLATERNLKPGDLLLPFRIMLVGGKFGPAVYLIAEQIGSTETIRRMKQALEQFNGNI
ncbi:MAG TPA: glutamate--tRNA ligase family protein, partial [Ferruginibacter sp.]|nr:glutamate--tRNA ligase family protein [Ferruginibacter sp.]